MTKRGRPARPIDEAILRQLAFQLRPDRVIAGYFGLSLRQYQRRLTYRDGYLAKVVQEARHTAAIVWSQRLAEKAERGSVPAMVALLRRAEDMSER